MNCRAYKSNNYFRLDIYILLIVLGRVLYGFYTKLIVLEGEFTMVVRKNIKKSQNFSDIPEFFADWGSPGGFIGVLWKNKPPSMGFYRGFYQKIIVF